jgi:hypothetical protein
VCAIDTRKCSLDPKKSLPKTNTDNLLVHHTIIEFQFFELPEHEDLLIDDEDDIQAGWNNE